MYWIELQYSNSSHASLQSSILISVIRDELAPGIPSASKNLPFKALNGWYFLLCVIHWSGGGGGGGGGSVNIAVKVSVCFPLSLTI